MSTSSRLEKLSSQIKVALLKPPPVLLKEVTELAVNCFGATVLSECRSVRLKAQKEERLYDDVYPIKKNWNTITKAIQSGKQESVYVVSDYNSRSDEYSGIEFSWDSEDEAVVAIWVYNGRKNHRSSNITTWDDAEEFIDSTLKDGLKAKEKIRVYLELESICQKYANDLGMRFLPHVSKGDVGYQQDIPVNVEGWDYVKKWEKEIGLSNTDILWLINSIVDKITFLYKGHSFGWDGSWDVVKRELEVCHPYLNYHTPKDLIKSFESHKAEILITCRHEVQHVAQTIMEGVLGKTFRGGYPKPEGLKEFDPRGFKHDKSDLKSDPKSDVVYRLDHALRDVEHQTRLSDEVDYFKQLSDKLSFKEKTSLYQWWVGISQHLPIAMYDKVKLPSTEREFFVKMKQHRPKRWEETSRQFYKLVF